MTQPAERRPAADVLSAAVGFLSAREHSRAELRRKLLARRHPDDLVESVLDDLEQRRLQSDARFAEAYVEQRLRKGYGPLRIDGELRARGVAVALIEQFLREDDDACTERLCAIAARRFGDQPTDDPRELARRARFFEQRGFPSRLVRRYLAGAGEAGICV